MLLDMLLVTTGIIAKGGHVTRVLNYLLDPLTDCRCQSVSMLANTEKAREVKASFLSNGF